MTAPWATTAPRRPLRHHVLQRPVPQLTGLRQPIHRLPPVEVAALAAVASAVAVDVPLVAAAVEAVLAVAM